MRDSLTSIRILDATLDYSDTSEDRVLATLEAAVDRSSDSDELADAMVDWPTRYHFSRMRGHLIRPLHIGPALEVLDVGCGTGAVTRAIGERGAQVLGIEGALPRARAAAVRCGDLDNVEIVCGDIAHLDTDRSFDLACLVGVLEYAAAAEGGRHGPESLLEHLRNLIRPDGALLIAIENQIGLKYLLGYREDHVGLPWAGVEDYAEGFGARTWSKHQLERLLTAAGFPAQRWLYPFPDYKMPSVILSESAFDIDAAPQFVDQLVARPVQDFAYPRTILTDDRRVHRVFLDADLGPEISNSFLVLASVEDHDLDDLVDRDVLAWILGGERRRVWKRTQVVVQAGRGLRVKARPNSGGPGDRTSGWLSQHPERDDPWFRGPTIEQLVLDACHHRDETALTTALGHWMNFLSDVQTPSHTPDINHPFAPATGAPALPADMLDVSPSNFVLTDHGIEYIDREWRVVGRVDPLLAILRALWFFCLDLVHGGARHLWSDDLTVDQVCCKMANLCGISAQPNDLLRMHRAEAELQSLVIGFDQARVRRDLRESGMASLASPSAACPVRWTHLHEFPGLEKTSESPRYDQGIEQLPKPDEEEGRRAADHPPTDPEGHSLKRAPDEDTDHRKQLATLTRRIESLQAKNDRLENLLPVKIYYRFRWWFSSG